MIHEQNNDSHYFYFFLIQEALLFLQEILKKPNLSRGRDGKPWVSCRSPGCQYWCTIH